MSGSCQPVLGRNMATQLQIIAIDKEDTSVFNPVKTINTDDLNGEFAFEIASVIQQYPNNFKGLGKTKDYQVKLYSDEKIKPVAVPLRPVPYLLQTSVADSLENMVKNGVRTSMQWSEAMGVLCSDCSKRQQLPARDFECA